MHKLLIKMATLMVLIVALVIAFNYIGCGGGGGGSSSGSSNTPSFLVTTNPATNITRTAVTLNGVVNPNGVNTTIYFQYGKTLTYGSTIGYQNVGSGTTNLNISVDLTGLKPNTLYNYRIRASRGGNTSSGANQTFTTAGLPPACVTDAASNIASDSARLNGTVNPNGLMTTAYFEYGITATPITYPISTTAQVIGTGTTGITMTATINSLNTNTDYNYRVVGINSSGTTSGNNLTFRTGNPGGAPTCNTDVPSSITYNSVILNGTVNPNGISTTAYFNYGLTTSYTVTTTGQVIGDGSVSVVVTETADALGMNTEYNCRVVGINGSGTTYGNNIIFTTAPPTPPTCVTNEVSNITSSSARLNGTVNPNGFDTTASFNYGLTTSYSFATSDQAIGSGMSNVVISATINSFSPNTPYNFRVMATNSGGTTYGENEALTTLAPLWNQTSNPSTGTDTARGITIDDNYIYIAGTDNIPGNLQWRVEKREKATGDLVAGFGASGVIFFNSPSTYPDNLYAIASDADYLYLSGTDGEWGIVGYEWRIEKRYKTNGASVTNFGTNGAVRDTIYTGTNAPNSIIVDSNYIYIAGFNASNSQWRIDKRDKTSGVLITAFGTNGTLLIDAAYSINVARSVTVDDNYLYIAGYDDTESDDSYEWRIEKRDKTTGALVTDFGVSGIIVSNPSSNTDQAYAIAQDTDYIYVAGIDGVISSTNSQWRMEKRSKTNGALVNGFGTNGVVQSDPSSGSDYLYSMYLQGNDIYIAGYDRTISSTDYQWRMEKRNKITGELLIDTFGTNGVITSNPSNSLDIPYAIITDINYIYMVGYDRIPGNYQWRIEKRYLTTGGQ
jgi:hypothetical protein